MFVKFKYRDETLYGLKNEINNMVYVPELNVTIGYTSDMENVSQEEMIIIMFKQLGELKRKSK